MPTYKFLNQETGEIFEDFLTISRKNELIEKNPHIIHYFDEAPGIVSSSGANKVPDGFKEVLSKVAEAHPESVVGDRYRRKSIKEVRTKQIVDNHYKKWKNN
jgi:hypothetical protein